MGKTKNNDQTPNQGKNIFLNKKFWLGMGLGLITTGIIVSPIVITNVLNKKNVTITHVYDIDKSQPILLTFSQNMNDLSNVQLETNNLQGQPRYNSVVNEDRMLVTWIFDQLTVTPQFTTTTQTSIVVPKNSMKFNFVISDKNNSSLSTSINVDINNPELTISKGQSIVFKTMKISVTIDLDQDNLRPSNATSSIDGVAVELSKVINIKNIK